MVKPKSKKDKHDQDKDSQPIADSGVGWGSLLGDTPDWNYPVKLPDDWIPGQK